MNLFPFLTTLLFFGPQLGIAQSDSSLSPLKITGYVEGYYSYDFNKPDDKLKPPFFYSFNRHNEPNINLALLKAAYTGSRFRSNVALMAGTYSQYNLAAEPGFLQNVYELNVGVKLGPKNLWLDAGIMSSHLGFESAIGKDCWNLTRSIMAENSPYYETGLKLGYGSGNGKWNTALFILLGWQRIKPVEGNSLPSFGTQVQYLPNEKTVLNSSIFIGTDKPDSARKMRYYHDLYAIYKISNKLALQAAFDIGAEQKERHSTSYNFWFTWVASLNYQWHQRIKSGVRFEYYKDVNGVIVTTETGVPMNVFGISVNLDVNLLKNLLWRLEFKSFSGNQVFLKENIPTNGNQCFTTSLAFNF